MMPMPTERAFGFSTNVYHIIRAIDATRVALGPCRVALTDSHDARVSRERKSQVMLPSKNRNQSCRCRFKLLCCSSRSFRAHFWPGIRGINLLKHGKSRHDRAGVQSHVALQDQQLEAQQ